MAKSDGKQGVKTQDDCGAHAAFAAADSPASVKKMAQGKTNYKGR